MAIRSRTKKLFGVGINDATYMTQVTERRGGKRRKVWTCPFYSTWANMLVRCYRQEYQDEKPSYRGCRVCDQWLVFSVFKAWMERQDWQGKHLDKDLLQPGCKLYSPETCVFVDVKLNSFVLDAARARGSHPVGANWDRFKGKFVSKCSNPFTGRLEHLGYFSAPEQAHEAWRRRKHEFACQYADMQEDPRIAQALRVRYAA